MAVFILTGLCFGPQSAHGTDLKGRSMLRIFQGIHYVHGGEVM